MVRTLLVIDDDPLWRLLYRLEFEGMFQVVEAADGQEGLLRYKETLPDLVIVDLQMPRMDGATFVRQLRRMRHVAPVIVCTSAPAEATPLVPPGVRVVSKWTDLKELRAAVSSFCVEPGHRL